MVASARRFKAVGVMKLCVTPWRAMNSNAHCGVKRCSEAITGCPAAQAGNTRSSNPPTQAQSEGDQ